MILQSGNRGNMQGERIVFGSVCANRGQPGRRAALSKKAWNIFSLYNGVHRCVWKVLIYFLCAGESVWAKEQQSGSCACGASLHHQTRLAYLYYGHD